MADLFRQTLNAGESVRLARPAGLFLLSDASGLVDLSILRTGSEIFGAKGLPRGIKIRPAGGFDEVIISNPNAAATLFEVYLTDAAVDVQVQTGLQVEVISDPLDPVYVAGPLTDAQLRAAPVVVAATGPLTDAQLRATPVNVIATGATLTATNVGTLAPDTLAAPADVAIGAGARVQVVAAYAGSEREVIVKNLTANTAALRVGDVACDATHGHELQPGEALTLRTKAAVYVWNTGAGSQSVSVVTNVRA